jgi:hypothetical protein
MSYKYIKTQAPEKKDDGWTTVAPKLTRADFTKNDVPVTNKYRAPNNREKKTDPLTFDEAFPELYSNSEKKLAYTAKPATKSLASIVKDSSAPKSVKKDNTPVVRSAEEAVNLREGVPETTQVKWEFSKHAFESQEPRWVAARAQVNIFVEKYGDVILSPYRVRVVDISDKETIEAPDNNNIELFRKLRQLREKHRLRNLALKKMQNQRLFDSSSESEAPVENDDDYCDDYSVSDDNEENQANDDEI